MSTHLESKIHNVSTDECYLTRIFLSLHLVNSCDFDIVHNNPDNQEKLTAHTELIAVLHLYNKGGKNTLNKFKLINNPRYCICTTYTHNKEML